MNTSELWQALIEGEFFTEQKLRLVTSINGYSKETLGYCIYARYGLRTFEDLMGE